MAENKNIFSQIGITPVQAIMVVGGGGLLYSFGRKLGLIKGDEDKKSGQLETEKMFEPTYLESLPKDQKYYSFTSKASVPDIAEQIYTAKGFFKDDMPKLWAAIKRMRYKTQVSQVNNYFTRKYGKEMIQYMKSYLNADEMAQFWDYLNKLPSGLV